MTVIPLLSFDIVKGMVTSSARAKRAEKSKNERATAARAAHRDLMGAYVTEDLSPGKV
jgi:hypothetical protein